MAKTKNGFTRFKIVQPKDTERIDLHDPAEVRNWCRALGCSTEELEKAIQTVDTSAEKVRKWLQ